MSHAIVTPKPALWNGACPYAAEERDLEVHQVRGGRAPGRAAPGTGSGASPAPPAGAGPWSWPRRGPASPGARWARVAPSHLVRWLIRRARETAAEPPPAARPRPPDTRRGKSRSAARPARRAGRAAPRTCRGTAPAAWPAGRGRPGPSESPGPAACCRPGPGRRTGVVAPAAGPAGLARAVPARRSGRACAASSPGPCGPRRRCRWPAAPRGPSTQARSPTELPSNFVCRRSTSRTIHDPLYQPQCRIQEPRKTSRKRCAKAAPSGARSAAAISSASCGETHSSASTK